MSRVAITRCVVDAVVQDFARTLRGFVRAPGVCIAVVVTFGLGIGANAALFTALDRVFFSLPPGVAKPGELRRLYAHNYVAAKPTRPAGSRTTVYLNARDLRELGAVAKPIAQVEADYLFRRGYLAPTNQRVLMTFVSIGYFDVLGVHAARGRLFAPEENQYGRPVRVVVISDGFWRTHFGGDSSVVGQTMRITDGDGESLYTVIGVAPPSFDGLELEVPDMWAPLPDMEGGGGERYPVLRVIARVRPGISDAMLASVLTTQYRRTHVSDPDVGDSSSIIVASAIASRGPEVSAATSAPLVPGMSNRSRELLWRLGLVGLVVLVTAVANVASLLLMRSMRRRREIAVRLALGVSRRRLIAQVLFESLCLALLASIAALVLAQVTGGALRSQLATFRWSEAIVDRRVMTFALLVGIVGGIIAGCVPAMFAVNTDLAHVLKAGGAGAIRSKSRTRTALLVIQSALCTALLACGGAFLQSFRNAINYDRGFDADRLIQLSIPAASAAAESETEDIQHRLRAMPGVAAVGRSFSTLDAVTYRSKVGPTFRDTIGVGPRGPSVEFVDAEFMRAAGFRLIAGRLFASDDDVAQTTVLGESLARALFPTGAAIGACVHIREPSSPCRTVVGIVRDVVWDVAEPSMYRLYVPLIQSFGPTNRSIIPNTLYVRLTKTTTAADVARLHEMIDPLAPRVTIGVRRVSDALAPVTRPWRLAATLFLCLGLLGLAAAATGIYGVISFDVTERSREFGVRLALGATPRSILQLVVGSGLRVISTGILAGVVAAWVMGAVVASLMFDASPFDPTVVVLTVGTLTLAAIAACIVPAWRAVRVDPVIALSAE